MTADPITGLLHLPYWNRILDADYCHACGDTWPCLTERQTAPHCRCSHAQTQHRYGDEHCWIAVCGCSYYRPQETK